MGIKYWWTVGFYLGLMLVLNHFQNFARGMDRIRLYAMSGVVVSVVNVLSNIVLMIIYKHGLDGYLLSLVISNFCGVIFLFFATLSSDLLISLLRIEEMQIIGPLSSSTEE